MLISAAFSSHHTSQLTPKTQPAVTKNLHYVTFTYGAYEQTPMCLCVCRAPLRSKHCCCLLQQHCPLAGLLPQTRRWGSLPRQQSPPKARTSRATVHLVGPADGQNMQCAVLVDSLLAAPGAANMPSIHCACTTPLLCLFLCTGRLAPSNNTGCGRSGGAGHHPLNDAFAVGACKRSAAASAACPLLTAGNTLALFVNHCVLCPRTRAGSTNLCGRPPTSSQAPASSGPTRNTRGLTRRCQGRLLHLPRSLPHPPKVRRSRACRSHAAAPAGARESHDRPWLQGLLRSRRRPSAHQPAAAV